MRQRPFQPVKRQLRRPGHSSHGDSEESLPGGLHEPRQQRDFEDSGRSVKAGIMRLCGKSPIPEQFTHLSFPKVAVGEKGTDSPKCQAKCLACRWQHRPSSSSFRGGGASDLQGQAAGATGGPGSGSVTQGPGPPGVHLEDWL